ncbi:glycosyltransferase [Flavobacteriaceae bacterium]|nr:glycosyltransferase [Flavobacteriaceae bacterium]
MPEARLKTLFAWRSLVKEVEVLFAYPKNYKRTIVDRVLHKIKMPGDANNINKSIKESCISFKPDIVFIVKGVTVKPSTLKFIKARGIKSISWSNDDMYGRHNRSYWYSKGLKYYDLVVTQKSYNCDSHELPSLGAKTYFQNKAFEPTIHKPVDDCKAFDCVHAVVFIGAKEQDRLEHLLYLAEHGIQVHIYGWVVKEPNPLHDNIIIHNRFLYEDEFCAAMGCSKISLNFLRKINRDLQTSRSVEIPACGGFMLAERTDEHMQLFKEGKEAEFFSSKEELLEKVNYYLQHDQERLAIAKAGYERCFKDSYTFENRMQGILNNLFDV